MKNYQQFQLDDFLEDAAFKDWVLEPTPEKNIFWQEFTQQFPDKKTTIHQAQTILLATKNVVQENFPTEEQVQHIFNTISANTIRSSGAFQKARSTASIFTFFHWAAAASIVLALGIGYFLYKNSHKSIYEKLVAQQEGLRIEEKNTANQPRNIKLSDGSTVTLYKNSQVSYPKTFDKDKREIILTGEAFFNVTKDPNRPFLVFSNELVTKVLGTSFSIRAFEADKMITVIVNTGRVSVFANDVKRTHDPEAKGVILSPNQQVSFERDNQHFARALVEKPALLLPKEQLQAYSFDDAPVTTIFRALEKAYGVDIIFDEDILANCRLTTSLTNETLFEKLSIICKGIDADYKVVDAQILIAGKGCK